MKCKNCGLPLKKIVVNENGYLRVNYIHNFTGSRCKNPEVEDG